MNLYILISDGGDGSYYPQYILDPAILKTYTDADNSGELCYPTVGCDGDGFHFSTLIVPDGSTPESLGLSKWNMLEAYGAEEEF